MPSLPLRTYIACSVLGWLMAAAIVLALLAKSGGPLATASTSASPSSTLVSQIPPQVAPVQPAVTQEVAIPVASTAASTPTNVNTEAVVNAVAKETASQISELLQAVKTQIAENRPPAPVATNTTNAQAPSTNREEVPPSESTPRSNEPLIQKGEGTDRLRLTLQDNDLRHVFDLLSQQGDLNILTSRNVQGTVSATLTDVTVDSALDAILKATGYTARREGNFIYVGTAEDFDQLSRTLDQINTRVYHPSYIRAADLSLLITPLLTAEVGKITVSAPALVDVPSSQTQSGGNSFNQSDVVVVRDYEHVLLQIDELIREIDLRPRQVMIDASVISVKLSDQNKLGINFQALQSGGDVKLVSGQAVDPANTANPFRVLNGAEQGLKIGVLGSSMTSLINALESVGETNVIASPRLLCLNKQRAEIQIGEQLGYVSTTVTETSATQSIQFLDVGTLLRIRPYISDDGTIRLDIHPELSTGTVTVSSGLTLPNKEVTQVTSNVMCQNGSTVVIGGLIREDLVNDVKQIPLLGNIPIAGFLFRNKTASIDRREILILITPRLVEEPQLTCEGTALGNEFLRRQDINFEKLSWQSKRYHALQYFRKAKAAMAAGDSQVALKYANLAVEYDPMSREAIQLRDEAGAQAAPQESVGQYLRQGMHFYDHPRTDYSKQGSPWKQGPAYTAPPPLPPSWTSEQRPPTNLTAPSNSFQSLNSLPPSPPANVAPR